MRSQFLVRRTRSLIKAPSISHRALLSSTHPHRFPRRDTAVAPASPRLAKRSSSSTTPAPASDPPPEEDAPETAEASQENQELTDNAAEDVEKPKRRAKPPQLPGGLNILWTPDPIPETDSEAPSSLQSNPALPPPDIFHEVLTNLHITLHPQTQHRAAYASPAGLPVEPTLALYCPIEGGDYIIDETVKELGRQVGGDVVVLDAVQLAAGETGQFGKAASVLQLPENPLHFPTTSSSPQTPSRSLPVEDEDDNDSIPSQFMQPSQVTLHVLTPVRPGRTFLTPPRRRGPSSMTKVKAFFDELINISPSTPEGSTELGPSTRRPRIVYIRDFPTLAASSSAWYPALLAAVRQRRQGPFVRAALPVYNPTTIVFGITPSIVPTSSPGPSAPNGAQGIVNYIMSRLQGSSPAPSAPPRPTKADYTEDEVADKARERRLLDRIRRWEKGDPSWQDDLPSLSSSSETEDASNSREPEMVIVNGAEGMAGLPSALAQTLSSRLANRNDSPDSDRSTRFFRTSMVVPGLRSLLLEKSCRMERRREINELTMRMGVASVGGILEPLNPTLEGLDNTEANGDADTPFKKMWEDWGRLIAVWSSVRKIADRVVGSTIASRRRNGEGYIHSLDATPVTWAAVSAGWTGHKSMKDTRKAWVEQSTGKHVREKNEEDEEGNGKENPVDEVVERVRQEAERGELDQHEQRLMACIVDAASLSTTFNQVHLPAHTIDSVRTIVSLPLLHPAAFQSGILKEHSMTGCLLFGPPGTGKTLVVKALAKEAGCRMLSISPSDVMDMYVGEAEKLVRSVFSLARRLSPCVVFIDEIDALFGARSSRETGGGDHAHRGVITEFMQEMDGLKTSKDDNIMVIGATNRPFDLDDAVLRRLPRRLLIDLPGEKEREEILKILLRDEILAPDVDLKNLAHKTESFSGSDLKHLCVSAALDAVKERVVVPWRRSTSSPNVSTLASSGQVPASVMTGNSSSASQVSTVAETLSPLPDASTTSSDAASLPTKASATVFKETPVSSTDATALPKASSASATTTNEGEAPSGKEASSLDSPTGNTPPTPHRTLSWRNFVVALKEITPSSSEVLGTLADLRKWNNEFGEGRKERKKQVWGKGRFGFTVQTLEGGDAKVQSQTPASSNSDTR